MIVQEKLTFSLILQEAMDIIEIRDFTHNGTKYILKEPILLKEDGNCAYNDDFCIMVVSYNPEQTEEFAKKQLSDLWGIYVEGDDRNFSKNAFAFKRKLKELVE